MNEVEILENDLKNKLKDYGFDYEKIPDEKILVVVHNMFINNIVNEDLDDSFYYLYRGIYEKEINNNENKSIDYYLLAIEKKQHICNV